MESTSLLRFLFLILDALLLLLLLSPATGSTSLSLSDKTDFLDYTCYSPWCTSKNCIQSKFHPHLIQSSSHSATTTIQDHESDVRHHPLDPLTIQEINAAHSILHSYPPFSSSPSSLAIHSLSLNKPPKPTILNWHPDDTLPPRHAVVVAIFYGDPYILSVNLSSRTITGHPVPTSGFPTMTVDDMTSSIWAPHANPAFNRSVLA